jgi:hypothetical protein
METTTKTMIAIGNCTLVQLSVTPLSSFMFKPGGPAIAAGGLVISEADGFGIVGSLVALNNTDSFLLLTDADILIGAKQNRVLNKSVLLAPFSKTMLDVSCIERGRWHYTTKDFSTPSGVADAELRRTKARSLADEKGDSLLLPGIQANVWCHISDKLQEENVSSVTESYADLVFHKEKMHKSRFPIFEPEKGCNGLAVIFGRQISCIDIFGTEEVFRYYFPKLKQAAFLKAQTGQEAAAIDPHEAKYRVLEQIDKFELTEKSMDTHHPGAGSYFFRNGRRFWGFDLEQGGELIHRGLFVE